MAEKTISIGVRLEESYVEFIDSEILKKEKLGYKSDRTDQIKIALMQRRLSLLSDEEIRILKTKQKAKEDVQDDLFSRKPPAPAAADEETADDTANG